MKTECQRYPADQQHESICVTGANASELTSSVTDKKGQLSEIVEFTQARNLPSQKVSSSLNLHWKSVRGQRQRDQCETVLENYSKVTGNGKLRGTLAC